MSYLVPSTSRTPIDCCDRSTLTDPSLLRVIQENEILVWGGDIRDKEAWSGMCRT